VAAAKSEGIPWIPAILIMMAILSIAGIPVIKSCYEAGMNRWHEHLAATNTRVASSSGSWGETPPKPAKYVTDSAGVIEPDRVSRLNEMLATFERETSNQIVVYVASSKPGDRSI